MLHGPIGRHPRRDVATRDGINRTISGREEEERVGHPLAQSRKDAGSMQRQIGAERKNDDGDQAGEESADASAMWRGDWVSVKVIPVLFIGCPPGIRTPISRSRICCPTIERGGNSR